MGVSIDQNTFETSLQLYPNPNDGTFFVDLGQSYQQVSIQLYDLAGKELLNEAYFNQSKVEIHTQRLSKGSYALRVISGERRANLLLQIR
jgi:hypothetical protein